MRKALQFLGFFTDGDINWLLSTGEVEVLQAGETLVAEGEMLDSVFIVVEGRLALPASSGLDRPGHLGLGQVVGEISAKPIASTVTAELPSRVLRLRRAALVDKCDTDADFANRLARVVGSLVSRRMQQAMTDDGQSPASNSSNSDSVELDAKMLDELTLAAKRFDWIRSTE